MMRVLDGKGNLVEKGRAFRLHWRTGYVRNALFESGAPRRCAVTTLKLPQRYRNPASPIALARLRGSFG